MYLLISSLLGCVVSASSVVIDSEPALLASNPSEWVNVAIPGANPASSLQVACSSRYGAQMEPRSCFNALDFAPLGDQQETWIPWPAGPVPPPRRPGVVQLPIMLLSNDTKCRINPQVAPQLPVGHASARNVSQAALAIIRTCVVPRRVGGEARNIGGDNRVEVLVTANRDRFATCGQPIRATPRSCEYILDGMDKSQGIEKFGRSTDPTAQLTVSLPLTLRSPDGLCQMVVDTFGGSLVTVTSSWAAVWFAAEHAVAKCVRQGKGGYIPITGTIPGSRQSPEVFRVTITDEPQPANVALPGTGNGTSLTGGEAGSVNTA